MTSLRGTCSARSWSLCGWERGRFFHCVKSAPLSLGWGRRQPADPCQELRRAVVSSVPVETVEATARTDLPARKVAVGTAA